MFYLNLCLCEGGWFRGTGIIDGCELSWGWWDLILGPLEEYPSAPFLLSHICSPYNDYLSFEIILYNMEFCQVNQTRLKETQKDRFLQNKKGKVCSVKIQRSDKWLRYRISAPWFDCHTLYICIAFSPYTTNTHIFYMPVSKAQMDILTMNTGSDYLCQILTPLVAM